MLSYRVVERDQRDLLGEGPLWSARDRALYWVDILAPAVHRLSLIDGSLSSWRMPEMIGWVIERAKVPGFIAGFQSGFAELTLDPFEIRPIADPEPHLPKNRLNDAKADRSGRIWAGSMNVNADVPSGGFYRLDPDRSVTAMDSGYIIANGPAFSPAHDYIYHTDSGRGVVYRFVLNADGTLGERVAFIEFEAGWGKRVCQVYCDSRDWDTGHYPPGFFDSAFVDGGHSYDIVANDTKRAIELVRAGGLIMWHDFCPLDDVTAACESTRDVVSYITAAREELLPYVDKLFWIEPSWLLVAVRGQRVAA